MRGLRANPDLVATFILDDAKTPGPDRLSDRATDQLRSLIITLQLAPGPVIDEDILWRRLRCGDPGARLGAARRVLPGPPDRSPRGRRLRRAVPRLDEAGLTNGVNLMVDGGVSIQSAEALVAPGVRAGWRPGRLEHAEMFETGTEVT